LCKNIQVEMNHCLHKKCKVKTQQGNVERVLESVSYKLKNKAQEI